MTDLKGQPRNVTDGQLALKCIPLPSIAEEVRRRSQQAETIAPPLSKASSIDISSLCVMRLYSKARASLCRLSRSLSRPGLPTPRSWRKYPSLTAKGRSGRPGRGYPPSRHFEAIEFFADHCVTESVCKFLEGRGHKVVRLSEKLPTDSADPVVAAYASRKNAVLISFDGDFNTIKNRLPKGARKRFSKLSRIHMQLKKPTAHVRIAAAMSLIEFEWAESALRADDGRRMWIVVQTTGIKTNR